MHQHHRRRKKRPNYGIRTVEVSRGYNGFGFTITGQQPCILSCIVPNSPADQAGLRAGDFLISVNGLNVSKLPHESVVQLIGNSLGTIRMQIAENYFSDSSDEENAVSQINRGKPRYLHHKLKMNRLRNSPQKSRESQGAGSSSNREQLLRPVIEDPPLHTSNGQSAAAAAAHNIIHSPNASASKDITNVSAMVRTGNVMENAENGISLEYRAIVGYLGTIEMPKQIATSSKLQTVRSCIRKMRQEKRNPTTVLMTILPNCLTLRSCKSVILATYPSSRLNYVSSSSESENRFFGLVTNTVHSANPDDDDDECSDSDPNNHNIRGGAAAVQREVIISNSCHVFVVDTKLCDHIVHEPKAIEFRITCTKDPISNLCLEFPNNSEYVVNLIRSMYTMRVLPPMNRNLGHNRNLEANGARNAQEAQIQANSPQPSNHSEVTTTSSNSDSGIGFHNDCTNISDRILVVDFPGIHLMGNRINPLNGNIRPLGICNNFGANNEAPIVCGPVAGPSEDKSKFPEGDFNTRLTVRAMPDPKTPPPIPQYGPDLLSNFDLIKSPSSSLTTTRSCDNVLSLVNTPRDRKSIQLSMDDISMLSNNQMPSVTTLSSSYPKDHIFMPPPIKSYNKKHKKPDQEREIPLSNQDKSSINKLSPKVFAMPSKANSVSVENLSSVSRRLLTNETKNHLENFEIWGSLQNIYKSINFDSHNDHILEGTYSEPDLAARALPTNTSPFRRWGQSSFRTAKPTESRPPIVRRPSSLAASDNDVYTKSMDNFICDLNTARSQSGDVNSTTCYSIQNQPDHNDGVIEWGNSFEKLLDDPAGIHTFAEFLKKEFSAENIYFWTACERYRQIDSDSDRAIQAMDIFSKHLANGALEPVNVDSQARNIAEDNLKAADRNLFSQAQKQIFNLMKFDSYQRFIRSDLYKKCLEAEEKKLPLPYPGEKLDELLKTSLTTPGPSKLKKSVSNAEDRRRKSLLPWHRKTRCKSRDRGESDVHSNKSASGKSQLSGNSLKIPMTNSASDIHSSRSSLSSFDATAAVTLGSGSEDAKGSCTLCRVILCDGATTIVQLRPDETVRQLVERLLEKRGIAYQMFDVIFNGCTKSIDLENPAHILAGKEVQIEQRVAFKLDLPDPKVISVKSKPKKVLCEVIKPILQKYNYRIEDVQILHRDTQEQMDLSLPVTVADGQRLQVVMLKLDRHYHPSQQILTTKGFSYLPPIKQSQILKPAASNNINVNSQQSTLDEITNKVFNELLQGKVEAHHNHNGLQTKNADQCSLKSEGCASETSSIFERLRRRDSNIPGFKGLRPKKENLSSKTLTTTQSDDTLSTITQVTGGSDPSTAPTKKPIIAKWKTGVKVQVTERTEKQDEFIEGLKRAQRARLEDQRGTEINFELPDFLKNKENLSAVNKLRKIRANLSPISKNTTLPTNLIETQHSPTKLLSNPNEDNVSTSFVTQNSNSERPQPAPRLSITKKLITSPIKTEAPISFEVATGSETISQKISNNIIETGDDLESLTKGPPPLPPKPKVLPIKPSNWGQNTSSSSSNTSSTTMNLSPTHASSKTVIDSTRRHLGSEHGGRSAYLDQPSSSFV